MDDMRHVSLGGIWWGYVWGVPRPRRELTFLCTQTLGCININGSLTATCHPQQVYHQERMVEERDMHRKTIPNKHKVC